jgi:phosphoesterase RecJ-like protein
VSASASHHYPELSPLFARLIESLTGKSVAVVGHARPDGDCIGAQVALHRVLSARGLDVICVNADAVPRRLQFLTAGIRFHRVDELPADVASRAAIFVDCADHARPGERLKAIFARPHGAIDHHLSNCGYAAFNLVEPTSAATCEMLAGMFLDLGLTIDAPTAQALFTGIMTDTGQFRFASASARCFRLAGELVARGAQPADAGFQLYERESAAKLRLLQEFLSSLRLECGGRVAIGVLAADAFARTGANQEDTEGLVDYARSIDGVDIGALIQLNADGSAKGSLRARNATFRVDQVAAVFNGGGHACAAGLSIKTGAAGFYERLREALTQRLTQMDAGNNL